MYTRPTTGLFALLLAGFLLLQTGCTDFDPVPADQPPEQAEPSSQPQPTPEPGTSRSSGSTAETPSPQSPASTDKEQTGEPATQPDRSNAAPGDVQVIANPEAITVLVNKTNKLPEDYKPADLTEPQVPFIFSEKSEKRLMREEAAKALEKMFAAAKQDGIELAGVSAYRSHATQASLYNYYVKTHGAEAANRFSAVPGHSEHETGLAIDVSGKSGECAAEDCFAHTKEAKWLAEHVAEFGFIIRYPEGKESVTGYQYEPWHLRYVGPKVAKEIAETGLTLEEYLGQAVPASR